LSVSVRDPLANPAEVGVKVTLTVHLDLAGTVDPQVFVCVKGDVETMLVMVSGPVPPLLSVTFWTLLVVKTTCTGKTRLDGDSAAKAFVPCPVRETICGVPGALSEMVRFVVSVPVATGAKLTLMSQLAPTANELPQLLVWVKSAAAEPLNLIEVMLRLRLPVFVKTTVCGELVVPVSWRGYERLAGESPTFGLGLKMETNASVSPP
jgi:hypothetical protein